jgi:hypothetical protein
MTRQSRKLLIIGSVWCLIGGACAAPPPPTPTLAPPTSTPAPTPTPGPLDMVKAFQATFNQQDTEGFLALFDDNPLWEVGLMASSKQAVRNNVEFWFQAHPHLELSDCTQASDIVSCKMTTMDDCNPPNVVPQHWDTTFVFSNGKIHSVNGVENSQELAAYDKFNNELQTWAQQNMPADAAKFYVDAEFDKLNGTGGQGGGKLTAIEFGQLLERICTAYSKAQK